MQEESRLAAAGQKQEIAQAKEAVEPTRGGVDGLTRPACKPATRPAATTTQPAQSLRTRLAYFGRQFSGAFRHLARREEQPASQPAARQKGRWWGEAQQVLTRTQPAPAAGQPGHAELRVFFITVNHRITPVRAARQSLFLEAMPRSRPAESVSKAAAHEDAGR